MLQRYQRAIAAAVQLRRWERVKVPLCGHSPPAIPSAQSGGERTFVPHHWLAEACLGGRCQLASRLRRPKGSRPGQLQSSSSGR